MFKLASWLSSLLLLLVVIGIFRGWFSFSSPTLDPQSDHVQINVSVDTVKVKADAKNAEQLTEKVAGRLKERYEK